jgi:hypothetical protein
MAARNKAELAGDLRVQKAWTTSVVEADDVDPRDELHWESLWHGFVIGKGRPDLATFTHYMRLGHPVAVRRPAVAAAAGVAVVEAEKPKAKKAKAKKAR